MRDKKWYIISLFTAFCIIINYIGKALVRAVPLPLWLDAIGTAAAAYVGGPVCGMIVGAAVNLIVGFARPTMALYSITNIAVGLTVGICARRKMYRDIFGAANAGFIAAVVSTVCSTPINLTFFGGSTNNMWGDGVIALLGEWGFPKTLSCIIGEFYIDFPDKLIMSLILFAGIKLNAAVKAKKGRNTEENTSGNPSSAVMKAIALLIAGSAALGSLAPLRTAAADNFSMDFSAYVQTIYDSENGLPGSVANDIAQTKDGILWVGTYNGLYRYNGSEFEKMEQFRSIRNANCLYTDEDGRLWVGTNDNGVVLCINEELVAQLNEDDGLPANSVRCITKGPTDKYYIGTSDSFAIISITGGLHIVKVIEEISYANSVSVSSDGTVAVVSNAGTLYILKNDEIVKTLTCSERGEYFTCCSFAPNDTLFVGTTSNVVQSYSVKDIEPKAKSKIFCGKLANMKSINFIENGDAFICADTGAGFLRRDGKYAIISTGRFNSSLDHSIVDYQGNVWFTSSRQGLLRLCQSVFSEMYAEAGLEERVVNSVALWNDNYYFATDSGMDAMSNVAKIVGTTLMEKLKETRIRSLFVDSKNHMWICTSGAGVWCANNNTDFEIYNSREGMPGDKFRAIIETESGGIVTAGDSGVAYIDNGWISKTITSRDGLRNPKVLCLLESEPGTILAGTDGNGIAVIRDREVVRHYLNEDGLSSEVILRMVKSESGNEIFIVTSNGLCLMDGNGNIKTIDDFPYQNNYDIVEHDGNLFVLSSAGIFVVEKADLLDGGTLDYLLLDSRKGLKQSLTPNSWNYIDEEDTLYLSTDAGVTCLNLNNYDISARSYRIGIKDLKVDGESYAAERGRQITIPRGAIRVEITPEIVNYSTNDPFVSIFLEGFDQTEKVILQSELSDIVYTNLPTGEYKFRLKVMDTRDTVSAETTYTIVKEKEIYDNQWFMGYTIFIFVFFILYASWTLIGVQMQRSYRLKQRELELFKKNVEIANQQVEIANRQLKMSREAILTIAKTVDARDKNTSLHSKRVAEYSVLIAKQLNFSEEELQELEQTALLHDIGKIGIPDSILNKPTKLTDEEYAIMKSHVQAGAAILEDFTSVKNIVNGALYHHERYDGKGYVHGLSGEDIPFNARIIGIADAFDAMTANRVYRKKLNFDYVVGELRRGKGTQFDPNLVDVMLKLIEDGKIDENGIVGQEGEK